MYNGYGNGPPNGMFHEPTREDLQRTANVVQQAQTMIAGACGQIGEVGQRMENLGKEMYKVLRKPRKKKGESQLVVGAGKVFLLQAYDDGTRDAQPFFENVQAEYIFYLLQFPRDITEKKLQVISFAGEKIVIFPYEKPSKDTIYQAFLEAGVIFNPNLSETKIKMELHKFVLTQTRYIESRMVQPISGWDDTYKKYLTGIDLQIYWGIRNFPQLPILEKMFPVEVKIEPTKFVDYLKKIPDKRLRWWMFIFPFLSLIASLIRHWNGEIDFYLNFVTEEVHVRKNITKAMSVFKSERVISLDDYAEKSIYRHVSQYGDEVIFFTADIPENKNYNLVRKIHNNLSVVDAVLTGKKVLPYPFERPLSAGGVIFSNYPISMSGTVVTLIDEEDIPVYEYLDAGQYKDFVEYFERNIYTLEEEFRKSGAIKGRRNLLKWFLNVLQRFFLEQRVDVLKELDIANIDECIDLLFDMPNTDIELEHFRTMIRKNVQGVKLIKINQKPEFGDYTVVYDSEYLMIPVTLMESWLEEQHLWHHRKSIFSQLKRLGHLKITEGYVHKIQIAHVRKTVYCIKLTFFNQTGEIPIEKLGGGNDAAR